jgi:hypothetical protein
VVLVVLVIFGRRHTGTPQYFRSDHFAPKHAGARLVAENVGLLVKGIWRVCNSTLLSTRKTRRLLLRLNHPQPMIVEESNFDRKLILGKRQ